MSCHIIADKFLYGILFCLSGLQLAVNRPAYVPISPLSDSTLNGQGVRQEKHKTNNTRKNKNNKEK